MIAMSSSPPARAASSASNSYEGDRGRVRRLIVDTDLGLDDLVALSILRAQCIRSDCSSQYQHTKFYIHGVTITPGISSANEENAELLRRLLPPDTPIYVCGNDTPLSVMMGKEKPTWWTRTASRVTSFLSTLPCPENSQQCTDDVVNAEEFLAQNINDPNVDFLCMAPLTTVARALQMRPDQQTIPSARFYIMGGIMEDSKVTQRGVSTAPYGYHDVIEQTEPGTATNESKDQFGEFNFALDIDAARAVLSNVSADIIPLEACTFVPKSLRCTGDNGLCLASVLADIQPSNNAADLDDEYSEARCILLKLLNEYGTAETQWDSIAAAIYCDAFGAGENNRSGGVIDATRLTLSELGSISLKENMSDNRVGEPPQHRIHPPFSEEDESTFFQYISFLLNK